MSVDLSRPYPGHVTDDLLLGRSVMVYGPDWAQRFQVWYCQGGISRRKRFMLTDVTFTINIEAWESGNDEHAYAYGSFAALPETLPGNLAEVRYDREAFHFTVEGETIEHAEHVYFYDGKAFVERANGHEN